ncbi:MAG: hypothetical protein ACYDBV_12405 [Nitrospiria bacterium]
MKRQMDLLNERHDLSRKVATEVTMSRGKPLPVGPTAKLKSGLTWQKLAGMSAEEIRENGSFPYLSLPHPNHSVGGMLFPPVEIKQRPRLERFDLDFDIPDHFLPKFQELLDFHPRAQTGYQRQTRFNKATDPEKRGEAIFFGKARCVACHPPRYYMDNLMHDLQMERFYKPRTIHGRYIHAEGPMKTFPLRGLKTLPPISMTAGY